MPNKQYLSGRRWEYETMKAERTRGNSVIRASGSHGEYDLVSYRSSTKPNFIQCKSCSTETEAKKLIKDFKASITPEAYYHQSMVVKVKGKHLTMSITV